MAHATIVQRKRTASFNVHIPSNPTPTPSPSHSALHPALHPFFPYFLKKCFPRIIEIKSSAIFGICINLCVLQFAKFNSTLFHIMLLLALATVVAVEHSAASPRSATSCPPQQNNFVIGQKVKPFFLSHPSPIWSAFLSLPTHSYVCLCWTHCSNQKHFGGVCVRSHKQLLFKIFMFSLFLVVCR